VLSRQRVKAKVQNSSAFFPESNLKISPTTTIFARRQKTDAGKFAFHKNFHLHGLAARNGKSQKRQKCLIRTQALAAQAGLNRGQTSIGFFGMKQRV
jgi:hypothetical protein